MNMIWFILFPAIACAILFLIPKQFRLLSGLLTVAATLANLILSIKFFGKEIYVSFPWAGFGAEFSLRLYHFSGFIILGAAWFAFAVALYCLSSMKRFENARNFFAFLMMSLAMLNGAVIGDNLIMVLFFWEGLMIPLYGMITIGGPASYKTAVKALIIVGVCDFCMILGITMIGHLAGTFTISKISVPMGHYASIAFILVTIGAISKAGSMPFHSWIPDAAVDAPLPFMALIPASLEKLLGIYFLARITLDMFKLSPASHLSTLLMIVGVATIIFAVMMALIQKDYKRLLSYHAISQVGYMILGVGTALPVGIIGGLFHMINHATYKSCLFLTGGSVERQAGTTDLRKLGGLAASMPVTFICFIVAAASISGVPPFNGFFSKELVYDAALQRGMIFYVLAVGGSFLTAASFLKLGHSAFLGKRGEYKEKIKEAPLPMLLPMIALAGICVFFGLYNSFPIEKFIQPILGAGAAHEKFSGFPANTMLVVVTVAVLVFAFVNHLFGVKKSGAAIGASDHIQHAPVLEGIYNQAQKDSSDPYTIGVTIMRWFSSGLNSIDRGTDWIYNVFSVQAAGITSAAVRRLHNGRYATYLLWSIIGFAIILLMIK
jgi:formate hydrogenlyase subunit 3/multisubunit Na+/H+ antiporter MnhD subunit